MYLLSAKDLMSERLESLATQHYELQPREDHAIRFSAENETLQDMIDSFGSVDASYAHYATTTAEGPGLQEAILNQPAYFTVVTRCVKHKNVLATKHPNGFSSIQIVPTNGCKGEFVTL